MYFYSVAANTDPGLGPYSVTYPITTDEDGTYDIIIIVVHFFFNFSMDFELKTVPMSSPTMLTIQASTSTSVTLTWRAPPEDHQNGVIRHYRISVNDVDTDTHFTVISLQTSSVISDLHPFFTYNFGVCAVTVGVGPCAYAGPIQLQQESELTVRCYMTRMILVLFEKFQMGVPGIYLWYFQVLPVSFCSGSLQPLLYRMETLQNMSLI